MNRWMDKVGRELSIESGPAPISDSLTGVSVKLANYLRGAGTEQQASRLGELMDSVENAACSIDDAGVQRNYGPISIVVKLVVEWALAQQMDSRFAKRCECFCANVQSFANRIPNDGNRVGLGRCATPCRKGLNCFFFTLMCSILFLGTGCSSL